MAKTREGKKIIPTDKPTPQPQEGLTEEQVIEGEIKRFISTMWTEKFGRRYDVGYALEEVTKTATEILTKLRSIGYLSPQEVKDKVEEARREGAVEAYLNIHTHLLSITCLDNYDAMSHRVARLLTQVTDKMIELTSPVTTKGGSNEG